MLTEGWDANTVTHVLGVRAFGTQLLCEQVIGRALRRQSYDLNEEGLFNVEYADVLGIPFDFTAKPVVAPPQPPRETIQVKAVRPERDALEIRFPRVEGYRVELPEERLTAKFNDDSVLELTPDLVGPVDHAQRRHHRRGRRPDLEHLGTCALHAALRADSAPALHQVARCRAKSPSSTSSASSSASPAVARHLPRLQGRHLPGAAHVQELADMACERITAGITRAFIGERPIKACSTPTTRPAHRARQLHTSKTDRWETARRPLPHQLGHPRQRLGRRVLPRRRVAPARCAPT
jgi:type III restriction enzyme